jgi:hypothetical protein
VVGVGGALTLGGAGATIDFHADVGRLGGGLVMSLDIEPRDPALLTLRGLVTPLLGASETLEDLLSFLPAGLSRALLDSGFQKIRLTRGPDAGQMAFEGQGSFFGLEGRALLEVEPRFGQSCISARLETRQAPRAIPDLLTSLLGDVDLEPFVGFLPKLDVALREVAWDGRVGAFAIGGELAGEGGARAMDVRLDLGFPGGINLRIGDLYAAIEERTGEHTPPSFRDLLDVLNLPAALRDGPAAFVPKALAEAVLGTRFASLTLSIRPGSSDGKTPTTLDLDGICQMATRSGERLARLTLGYVSGTDGGWRIDAQIPLLRANLTDLLEEIGLEPVDVTLPEIELELQGVSLDQPNGQVQVDLGIEIDGYEALLSLSVRKGGTTGPKWALTGTLTLGDLVFTVKFGAEGAGGASFTASLRDTDDALSLARLARLIGWDGIPDALDVALETATLVVQPSRSGLGFSATLELGGMQLQAAVATLVPATAQGGQGGSSGATSSTTASATGSAQGSSPAARVYLAGANLVPRTGLSLQALPVVGPMMPGPSVPGLQKLRLILSSSTLQPEGVAAVQGLVPDFEIVPAGRGLTAGVAIDASLRLLTSDFPFSYGMFDPSAGAVEAGTAADTGAQPTAGGGVGGGSTGSSTTVTVGKYVAPSGGSIQWTTIGRWFGPIRLDRVGMGMKSGGIELRSDGGFALGPVTLTLDGMGGSSSLRRFDPDFSLDGLGLDFRSNGL